ncbi:AmpG family muropeptide MFS transporter [Hylemonella gracilis]|uniref:Major facilitator superfamily protein n=1 Tax=Hylemonella gracilis ATCC 19624 TaxID=887062 RepID=F3KTB7_9BURK|nr:MFS transporter [Hylemonella gracilis]EGI77018.1 major facilitator superfamily protein [Hylemonella gracilis ATCC 19624]
MSKPLSEHPAPAQTDASDKLGWLAAWRIYLEPATLRMLALGFAAGLPLLLVLGTLSFRLREAGIDRATIGYLSWIGLAYGFKWIWSPLVDRLPLPGLTRWLGQRRGWLLLAQLGVAGGLIGMALADPRQGLHAVAGFAVLVAFASATQDIALDAYRIESASTERQAALAAAYQAGYRLAMIWAGAGVLWLAARAEMATLPGATPVYQNAAWTTAYLVMAASMLPGMLTVLLAPAVSLAAAKAPAAPGPLAWLRDAIVEPFLDFVRRYRWQALLILALIAIYRVSDLIMGIMANPFYVDMGYSKDEVAAVTKIYGLLMTLAGSFLGGALALRLGVMRVLMLGAVLSAATNLLFAWLSTRGHDVTSLIYVISADNLASGLASAAFIAYLSGLTNVTYSATQYALFSSMYALAPKFVAGFSGEFVDAWGYSTFFTSTALLGVPVLVLVALASRVERKG